ncbi:hypothetical protein HGI79_20845 [Clostridium sp. DJ247]|nr:hypothetical protein [Clostridium sp. DJ247]
MNQSSQRAAALKLPLVEVVVLGLLDQWIYNSIRIEKVSKLADFLC